MQPLQLVRRLAGLGLTRAPGFILALLYLSVMLPSQPARAADCPAPPVATKQRRQLASDWFSQAEAAEASGRDRAAVSAYSCSFALVPHAFTAYNLARVAEGVGELELALQHYREYLSRQKNPSDRPAIEERIDRLKVRLEARAAAQAIAAPATPAVPQLPAPEAAASASPPEASPPTEIAPPAPAASALAESNRPPEPTRLPRMNTTTWVIAGLGGAALVTGIVFNLEARRATDRCEALVDLSSLRGARSACDRGRYFAERSYLLFGLAGLAAVTDLALLVLRKNSTPAVQVTPLRDGAAVVAGARF
jgi:hypothetical protein